MSLTNSGGIFNLGNQSEVFSLNGLTGPLTLTSTDNSVVITPSGQTINLGISSSSEVVSLNGLKGALTLANANGVSWAASGSTITPSLGNITPTSVVASGNISGAGGSFTSLTDSALTLGSVVFAGTGGLLSQNNSNLFWDNTNDRLGIGTAAPGYPLDVESSSFSYGIISLFKTSANADTAFQIQNSAAAWQFSVRNSIDSNPGGFNFYYSPNGTSGFFNAMYLTTAGNVSIPAGTLTVSGTGNSSIAGNVGIGTSTPQATLDVNGQITTNGGTNKWQFGGYTSGAAVQAGKIAVTINGTSYNLLTA